MPIKEYGEIVSHQEIACDCFLMIVKAPQIAQEAEPGQFVHLRVSKGLDPLLRRPISLHGIDKEKGEITLLYYVVGKGTKMLSEFEVGEEIDLMGPLGTGFNLNLATDGAIVVGGGMGIAPVLPLVKELQAQGKKCTVILGARSGEILSIANAYEGSNTKILLATDDGSLGHKGFVTDLLKQELEAESMPVFTCGPHIMMEKVTEMVLASNQTGQVSLEERMGCGVGACLSCVCKVKVKAETGFDYKKACTDGPVFNMEEVMWHE